jgi:prepilin-type processing-associated H-X9-DG protein
MRRFWSERGVTITELLTVIAIIMVLVSITVMGGQRIRAYAFQIKCHHRLEQIGQALHMYKSAHRGYMPPSWQTRTGATWYDTLAHSYLDNRDVLGCPVVDTPALDVGWVESSDAAPELRDATLGALRWMKNVQVTSEATWWEDDGREGGYAPELIGRWHGKSKELKLIDEEGIEGATGLALTAFLRSGITDKHPAEFADSVILATRYLARPFGDVVCSDGTVLPCGQIQEGEDAGRWLFGTGSGGGKKGKAEKSKEKVSKGKGMYTIGICTMAMAEAAVRLEDPELRKMARRSAELGLGYILRHQPDHGGFAYHTGADPDSKDSDNSVSAFVYEGLAVAKAAGLHIPADALAKTDAHFALATHWSDGDDNGGVPYKYAANSGAESSDNLQLTAAALTCRLTMGESPSSAAAQAHAQWLANQSRMDSNDNRFNYFNYYMGIAARMMGGVHQEDWANYYVPLVLANQDPEGWWPCATSERVAETAWAVLGLTPHLGDYGLPVTPDRRGRCSYGYNKFLGADKRTIAADTILVMDYDNWEIDPDDLEDSENGDAPRIASRHSGHASALMGDGHVRDLAPTDILPGMWTTKPGD